MVCFSLEDGRLVSMIQIYSTIFNRFVRFGKFDEAQRALQDFPDGVNNMEFADGQFKIRVSVALTKEEREKRALKRLVSCDWALLLLSTLCDIS